MIPNKILINEFESKISVLRSQIIILLDMNDNLRRTRDLLLPKLISGEIDVDEIEIETQ